MEAEGIESKLEDLKSVMLFFRERAFKINEDLDREIIEFINFTHIYKNLISRMDFLMKIARDYYNLGKNEYKENIDVAYESAWALAIYLKICEENQDFRIGELTRENGFYSEIKRDRGNKIDYHQFYIIKSAEILGIN